MIDPLVVTVFAAVWAPAGLQGQEGKGEIGVGPAILRSCLTQSGDKIVSASIWIHQPQRSITRNAFGTLIIVSRRIAGLTQVSGRRFRVVVRALRAVMQ